MNVQQLAGALPSNPQFRQWVALQLGVDVVSKDDAAQYIRTTCGVRSRKELPRDAGAVILFHRMRRQFVEWCSNAVKP